MKFLINKKKLSNLRRIYLVLYFLGYIETAFSGSSSSSKKPVPVVLDANDFHAISAYCLDQQGKIEEVSETSLRLARVPTTFESNGTRYFSHKFYRDPDTDLARDNLVVFDYCKNQKKEVDLDHMYLMAPTKFGADLNKQKASFDFLQQKRKEHKGNLYIPLSVLDNQGNPQRLQDDSSKTYIVLNIDNSGIMSSENLKKISDIRLDKRFLAVDAMISKAQEISLSGNKISVEGLGAQLKGIQDLGDLYTANISAVSMALGSIKQYSYTSLSENVRKIMEYFPNAEIGNANTENTYLRQMTAIYNTSLEQLSAIKSQKDKVRVHLDAMNEIAKKIPGEEAKNLDEFITNPKKYTIPFRLISDSLGGDNGLVRLFYTCDQWEADLKNLGEKVNQLQSVHANFIKNTTNKIDDLNKSIKDYSDKKRIFERFLEKAITEGTAETFNTFIDAPFKALEDQNQKINTDYSKIVQSIEKIQNVQDPNFQSKLAQTRNTLNLSLQEIQNIAAYQKTLPTLIQDAYSKIVFLKIKNFKDLETDANQNIVKLNDLVKPVIEAITKEEDAKPLWQNVQAPINVALNLLEKIKKI
ncbi:hypothetical protein HE1_00413 [Holospora elegans E1]|uniref:Uncharacterized protein n=1 Tax=Holospora elegans E1 TaxID=1427503 RepID=A0A023DXH1_9PROT|nr:hypothetical protein [Holospora elegans]GAJ46091.1 hypothetical protein HE1_00413 [Holospora elegans E1]